MNRKVQQFLFIAIPFGAFVFFLFMTFSHSSHEHPGRIVYYGQCASCHGQQGQGVALLVPPLMNADYLQQHFLDVPCMILKGMNDTILVNGKSYYQPMYPIKINEVEMANLMNFMRDSFLLNPEVYPTIKSEWADSIEKTCQ